MTCAGLFGATDDANAAAALVGGGAVATLFGVSMFSPGSCARSPRSAAGRSRS